MQKRQLIDATTLDERRTEANLRIVDCRFDLADPEAGRREYAAGHIPGAAFLDLNRDLASPPTATSGRHPLPAVDAIVSTLGGLGIDHDTEVVVYDADSGAMAARAWWVLRWLGHNNVRLLDGGISRWRALSLPLASGVETYAPRRFVAKVRSEMVIGTEELQGADLEAGGARSRQ